MPEFRQCVRLFIAIPAKIVQAIAALTLLCITSGCPPKPPPHSNSISPTDPSRIDPVNLSDVARPAVTDQSITLHSASNEWTNFAIRVAVQAPRGYWLRVRPPVSQNAKPIATISAYQVLAMPIDMDRAGYVRHTGNPAVRKNVPRALLAQPIDSDGNVNLSMLRNPSVPTDIRSHAGGPGAEPALLWFDVHVPKGTPAGDYAGKIDLMTANNPQPIMSTPLKLTVYDIELPNERHLQMVGQLSWDRLEKLYPEQFETFTPKLVNRRESRYQATVRTLDHLISLAQENRANLTIPDLKPIVKWPTGEGPLIDWGDFDSMVRPWFDGSIFRDKVGIRFWPMPKAELLERYERSSQMQYWQAAANHFDANSWLGLTAVSLDRPPGDEHSQATELCSQAAELLRLHRDLRVLLPLQDEQLQVATDDKPGIPVTGFSRLLTASAALVSAPPPAPWKRDIPRHWLRTDLPGLVPYVGAGGDERDVRVWAWLAFLRHLDAVGVRRVFEQNFILWDSTLPAAASPEAPADPGEMVWFYPGEWFGVDVPVPTLQLKWLRRAQQDYEYLLLAQQSGETINALQLARLITKPVELRPGQTPDPVYALATGATDQRVWDEAHRILAETILLRRPGVALDVDRQRQLYIQTLQLSAPQERRLLLGRHTGWAWSDAAPNQREPGTWVDLAFSLDIYNASETTPDHNRLRWAQIPAGWVGNPQDLDVPKLESYHVQRAVLRQRFNLDHVSAASREPIGLQFEDGFSGIASPLKVVIPVAICDRREGRLAIDGQLDDWNVSDALHDGPLIRMFTRPALQHQELQTASTPSAIYSSWARENFYLAFAVEGLGPPAQHTRNFVEYQQRRAWGEDLCEVLIQAIALDNKLGPVLHVVCKPNGGVWVERKAEGASDDAWKPLDAAGIRYAATTPDTSWRGEVAIPWQAINGDDNEAPVLLKFNFAHHRALTGETASWAGPVDFGRDNSFMGLLYLRVPGQKGLTDIVRGEGTGNRRR